MFSHARKVFQRRLYDIVSNKNYVFIIVILIIILIVSILSFGEAILEWANHKYSHYASMFEDNLMQYSFQKKLCARLPIDIVYTWVNGSDPKLLKKLNLYKDEQEISVSKLNQSHPTCLFADCIQLSVVIAIPPLSRAALYFTTRHYPYLKLHNQLNQKRIFKGTPLAVNSDFYHNLTLLRHINVNGVRHSVYPLFATSELTAKGNLSNSHVILTNSDVGKNKTWTILLQSLKRQFTYKWRTSLSGSSVLLSFNSTEDKSSASRMVANISSAIYIKTVYLIWDLKDATLDKDASPSRFVDNEELRFSLRSVEKFVPWVHRIFLVTNGQVPSWLDLSNPRLKVVTHREIFANLSHLPTFSSPAIESNLHRIPGLSERFIYMNDDVFFGKEVFPSDFYTEADGYKVYLTWPVPNCRDDCPVNWLHDNYCDKACNYSECGWDGGDCLLSGGQAGYVGGANNPLNSVFKPVGGSNVRAQLVSFFLNRPACSPGCVDTWLADRYCDQPCNVAPCGFDVGDCGNTMFSELLSITADVNVTEYHTPKNSSVIVVNLTPIIGAHGNLVHGDFDQNPSIRVVTMTEKYKRMFVLVADDNEFNVTFTVSGTGKPAHNQTGQNITYAFTLFFNSNVTISKVAPTLVGSSILPETPNFTGYLNSQKYPPLFFLPKKSANDTDPEESSPSKVSIPVIDHRRPMTSRDKRLGFMPWEKRLLPRSNLEKSVDTATPSSTPTTTQPIRRGQRRLLDTFADSLRHTNLLLSQVYGQAQRKVPAHMPHFMDRGLLTALHHQFRDEWQETSSHRIRSSKDLQFSLTYYYYLMSENAPPKTTEDFLNKIDTDSSGSLNDYEIRLFAIKLFSAPLDKQKWDKLFSLLRNCTGNTTQYSIGSDFKLKSIPLSSLIDCPLSISMINESFSKQFVNRFRVLEEGDVYFKMIGSNASNVLHHLDEIISSPRKFFCLNDNLLHNDNETLVVKKIMRKFLEHLYPFPSRFELKGGRQNHNLYVDDSETISGKYFSYFWKFLVLWALKIFLCGCICPATFRSWKRWICRKVSSSSRKCKKVVRV